MRGLRAPIVLLTALAVLVSAAFVAQGAVTSDTTSLKIVFSAVARDPKLAASGAQMIYTTGPGGSGLRQVTPYDGYSYDWPTWAFGGSKIVYTRRSVTDPASGENLFLMDADGSHPIQLTFSTWRNVQPKVSPDGQSVIFTAQWPEFPKVAVFKLDLATLTVVNLSSPTSSIGARSSDPRWVGTGDSIVFSDTRDETRSEVPTQVYRMDAAGGARERLTFDSYYNADPAVAPVGSRIAVSSYRGPGVPHRDGQEAEFAVKLQDWHLVVIDPRTRTERVLTQGLPCATRVPPHAACAPNEGPAWVPVWSPDGDAVGFLSVRSATTMGIYAMSPDGGPATAILESTELALTWWDWVDPAASRSARAPVIGPRPDHGLLIGVDHEDRTGILIRSTADRWSELAIVPATAGLKPRSARWTADRRYIIFSAVRSIGPRVSHVTPPGAERHVRYTLPEFTSEYEFYPDQSIAEEQVYVMDADGQNVQQITTPWTEDHLEALDDADLRANIEPDVSPDGRYVIFTSVSTLVDETMILRVDVTTGEVLNLSAVTAGALTVRDSGGRFSPDGSQIAFTSSVGATRQLFVMRADGTGVRQLTDDDNDNADPAWAPDGTALAFASHEVTPDPLSGWSIVRLDIAAGRQQVLTRSEGIPAFRPVWSPDGVTIAYISTDPLRRQPDLRLVQADGSRDRVLITLLSREASVDWR